MLDKDVVDRLGLQDLGLELDLMMYIENRVDPNQFIENPADHRGYLVKPLASKPVFPLGGQMWNSAANSEIKLLMDIGPRFSDEAELPKLRRMINALNGRVDRRVNRDAVGDAFLGLFLDSDSRFCVAVCARVPVTSVGVTEQDIFFLKHGRNLLKMAHDQNIEEVGRPEDQSEIEELDSQVSSVRERIQRNTRTEKSASCSVSFSDDLEEIQESADRLEVPPADPDLALFSQESLIRVGDVRDGEGYYPITILYEYSKSKKTQKGRFMCDRDEAYVFTLAPELGSELWVNLEVDGVDRNGDPRGTMRLIKSRFDLRGLLKSCAELANRAGFEDEFLFELKLLELCEMIDSWS